MVQVHLRQKQPYSLVAHKVPRGGYLTAYTLTMLQNTLGNDEDVNPNTIARSRGSCSAPVGYWLKLIPPWLSSNTVTRFCLYVAKILTPVLRTVAP